VKRLVHVSALGVGEQAEHLPSRYLHSKARGELALHALPGLALTVLRPSVVFGARDRFLNTFAALQRLSPVMPLAGAGARFQPVWVGDVAAALLRCLHDDQTVGQTYEIAGPEVFTLRQLVQFAGRCAGVERPVLPLPGPLATLQALALECLPGEPLMSRDNLASMKVPNVATGQLPGLAQLGIAPKALAAVAPRYLAPGQDEARLDAYRARR
jgi:NADH dehydrogenase